MTNSANTLTNFRVTTGKIVRSVKVVGHSQYGTEVAIRADVSDRDRNVP
jgi:hypothetical protein